VRWSDREVTDGVVVALLGVGEGEAGVDLQGLAGGVAAVGLDERVVDALGLEPGEQEVAQRVRADRGGDARGMLPVSSSAASTKAQVRYWFMIALRAVRTPGRTGRPLGCGLFGWAAVPPRGCRTAIG